MNIVIVGHVDHGKSTIIGRLLADTGSLPEGKLQQVKENCLKNSKPFEYAFLLDALKDEQSQGITIDSARVFFKTKKRDYIIIDAPGHIEFLKNMVTGAARAETALLVIDAQEGIRENSFRHGYMLSMLGIKQVVILINKMDIVDYDKTIYDKISEEYTIFLNDIGIFPKTFIPVSGVNGDCVASLSNKMKWYDKQTVLEILDEFEKEPGKNEKPFRMPVQDVYKFTNLGDDRRIISGTVETGTLHTGDEIIFYPSGKRTKIKTIEGFNQPESYSSEAGFATGFTLEEQIYVKRGEIATRSDEQHPYVSTRIKVSLFWLGKNPMIKKKEYFLKLGTARIPVRLEKILRVIDTSNLNADEKKQKIERHDVAECILKLEKQIAFDTSETNQETSRFVIVDDYEIRGGGIIKESLEDSQTWLRDKVFLRNYKWIKSDILPLKRAEKYNQRATLFLITGESRSGRKEIAKKLESKLFADGRIVYYLGLGSILYGVDADITRKKNHKEHIRRLAEVAHILLDAGILLIITARELKQEDLEIIKSTVDAELIETVWVGKNITTDISFDLHLENPINMEESLIMIKELMQEKGIIYKVW